MERTKVVPRDEESIRLGMDRTLCADRVDRSGAGQAESTVACSGVRSGADMVLIVLAFGGWNQEWGKVSPQFLVRKVR